MLLSAVKTFGYVVDTNMGREDYTEERKRRKEEKNYRMVLVRYVLCSKCLVTVSVKRLSTFLDMN